MTQQSETSLQGLAPPAQEPNDRGCRAGYHSPFCECLSSRRTNRLILAAKELLQVVDAAPIRTAALACGAELYEKAAALIDAVTEAEAEAQA